MPIFKNEDEKVRIRKSNSSKEDHLNLTVNDESNKKEFSYIDKHSTNNEFLKTKSFKDKIMSPNPPKRSRVECIVSKEVTNYSLNIVNKRHAQSANNEALKAFTIKPPLKEIIDSTGGKMVSNVQNGGKFNCNYSSQTFYLNGQSDHTSIQDGNCPSTQSVYCYSDENIQQTCKSRRIKSNHQHKSTNSRTNNKIPNNRSIEFNETDSSRETKALSYYKCDNFNAVCNDEISGYSGKTCYKTNPIDFPTSPEKFLSESVIIDIRKESVKELLQNYVAESFLLHDISPSFINHNRPGHEKYIKNLFVNSSFTTASCTTQPNDENSLLFDECDSTADNSSSIIGAYFSKQNNLKMELENAIENYCLKNYNNSINERYCETNNHINKELLKIFDGDNALVFKNKILNNIARSNDCTQIDTGGYTSRKTTLGTLSNYDRKQSFSDELKNITLRKSKIRQKSYQLTDKFDKTGINKLKTLDILYPATSQRRSSCSSCKMFEGMNDGSSNTIKGSEKSFADFRHSRTGELVELSETIHEESEEQIEQELHVIDYVDNQRQISNNRPDVWECFNVGGCIDENNTSNKKKIELEKFLKNPQFKEGVISVLKQFLKEHILISTLKGKDYDIFIFPRDGGIETSHLFKDYLLCKTRPDSKSFNVESTESRKNVDRDFLANYCIVDHQISRLKDHSSKKKHSRSNKKKPHHVSKAIDKTSAKYYDYTRSMNSSGTNRCFSVPALSAVRHERSNFSLVGIKNIFDKDFARFMNREPPEAFLNVYQEGSMLNGDKIQPQSSNANKAKTDRRAMKKLAKALKLKKKHKSHRNKDTDILSELNKFEKVLNKVESRNNALIKLFNYDPCGLLFKVV